MKTKSTNLINIDNRKWRELIKKSRTASFFQTKEWISLWTKHFSAGKQLFLKRKERNHILGVFDRNDLIGIAPFEIKNNTFYFLGINPVLGEELVSDFGDIIAKISFEKIVWEEIFAELKRLGSKGKTKQVELRFIREDSPSLKILQELGGEVEEADVAPYIDLPWSWEEYLASLSRKSRHELRRKIRKLERGGAYEVYTKGDIEDMGEFFRLMALSSHKKKKFLSGKMKEFFQDIFTTFSAKKQLNLSFLKYKNVNIAATLTFKFKSEVLLYNCGFDPKYSYLAPGFLLNAFIIKRAIEAGKRRFDFLRGEERYKYDLGGRKRKLYKVIFNYPSSLSTS